MPSEAPTIAVSSWSVHRALGIFHPNAPGNDVAGRAAGEMGRTGAVAPGSAAGGRGARHPPPAALPFPSREPRPDLSRRSPRRSLRRRRDAFDAPDRRRRYHPSRPTAERDRDWIGNWIDAAAELGAGAARVIAGKQRPTPETLAWSVEGLARAWPARRRAGRARHHRELAGADREPEGGPSHSRPARRRGRLHGRFRQLEDHRPEAKYDDLASILARSEDTHAKAWFPDDAIDAEDFGAMPRARRRASGTTVPTR